MADPSLRQLEALLAVVETGTVSKAADLLRVSQPAVSKRIQDLEAETGLQLFERQGRRLVATDQGMRLYEEVDRVLGGVHQLARSVEAIHREVHGRLVLGVLPALGGRFISRILRSFHAQHPKVFVSVEAQSSQFLTEAVLLRRLDVAIVSTSVEHPSITAEMLRSPAAVAILPPGHRLEEAAQLNPADLIHEPFVAFSSTGIMRRKVDRAFEGQGVTPQVAFEATNAANVGEMVAAGLGVSIVDPLSVEFLDGRIIRKPFSPIVDQDYTILKPLRARKSAIVADFVEHVRGALARNDVGRQ
ncbi:LysR substrate-binding domain-containing protein (plasmid) [Agrobacterium vitis]|uniref:LysR substrate-binding domain-containing protein n=1 Tax=Agrobacterium vitis TaxID=373 RepID=UPI0012E79EAF|nr:LysR substrate-binding domain-containing protein [Agrobacterium vitis]MVA27094.1 LysR family transcriptional regulator [Agrobacterium vitis]